MISFAEKEDDEDVEGDMKIDYRENKIDGWVVGRRECELWETKCGLIFAFILSFLQYVI